MPPDPDLPLPRNIGDDALIVNRDLRDQDFMNEQHLVMTALIDFEAELEKIGWDRPDFFGALFVSEQQPDREVKPDTGDREGTGYLWFTDLEVPAVYRGRLLDILQSLEWIFDSDATEMISAAVSVMLDGQPDGAMPLAIVAVFEGWTIVGRTEDLTPEKATELATTRFKDHPDGKDTRHIVMCFMDGSILQLMRVRGQQPEFITASDQTVFGDSSRVLRGIRRVAGHVAEHCGL